MIDTLPQLTLGLDVSGMIETLVTIVIFAVIVIGSIVQSLKESSSKKKSGDESDEPTEAEKRQAQDRLRELAEKRRRQLEELARRRREAQGREETERRPTSTPMARTEAPPQHRRETPRRQADPADDAMRRARLERARAERAAKAERERQLQLQRQQAELQHRERRQAERDRTPAHRGPVGTHEQTHRHVRDAAPAPKRRFTQHGQWLSNLPNMRRETLQRAVLLQEVLNKPLALRDPFDAPIDRH